jgi:hypothetical protein
VEEEERKLKAIQRTKRTLGVDPSLAEDGASRPRRTRKPNINYAFSDYDSMMRSAIKRSMRSGEVDEEEEEEEGRRRRVSCMGEGGGGEGI